MNYLTKRLIFAITIGALVLFFGAKAMAQTTTNQSTGNQNVNICKPTVIVKGCSDCGCKKPRVVTKVVEKVVEKQVVVEKEVPVYAEKTVVVVKEVQRSNKNHVALLGGYGARGNLVETSDGTKTETRTENGPVFGLQYMRDFGSGKTTPNALIQIQTNRTLSVGVGLSF